MFRVRNSLHNPFSVTMMLLAGCGPFVSLSRMVLTSSSLLKTEENCWFKIFALDSLSEYVRSSVFLSDAIPVVSQLLLFMKL